MNQPDTYRTGITIAIDGRNLSVLDDWMHQLQAAHPPGSPRQPKRGQVVDKLIEHAKQTGFAPLKPISDGHNAHRSTKTKTK